MIITERREADFEIDKIKNHVKESFLAYFIEESPFTLRLYIKKKLLRDFSAVSRTCSPPSTDAQFYQPHSLADQEASKSELETTNLENNQLKEDIIKKDTLISQMKSDLIKMETQNEQIKKDIIS